MADEPSSVPPGSSNAPGQAGAPAPSGVSGAQFEEYESPTFDLHAPAAAQPQPVIIPDQGTTRFDPNVPVAGERVQVGQETIEIAPHPTTNRFPWKPVQNPTLPVYGTAVEQAAQQPPVEPQPAEAVLPVPEVPAEKPPEPEPTPVVEAPPEPVEVAPVPETAPPAPEPAPVLPEPEPVVTPPVAKQSIEHTPVHHRHPIFSESTRIVWQVLRPGKLLAILLAVVVIAVIVAIIYAWNAGNGSFDLDHLPFVNQLLRK